MLWDIFSVLCTNSFLLFFLNVHSFIPFASHLSFFSLQNNSRIILSLVCYGVDLNRVKRNVMWLYGLCVGKHWRFYKANTP